MEGKAETKKRPTRRGVLKIAAALTLAPTGSYAPERMSDEHLLRILESSGGVIEHLRLLRADFEGYLTLVRDAAFVTKAAPLAQPSVLMIESIIARIDAASDALRNVGLLRNDPKTGMQTVKIRATIAERLIKKAYDAVDEFKLEKQKSDSPIKKLWDLSHGAMNI